MDRFSIIIEKQSQLESIIKQLGFMPFFKNTIEGFSIEEMTPPELLFGDDMENGPWQWKGPIISNWQSAYGKFFRGKAGYVSLEWLPDFMNWRRTVYPIDKESEDSRRILDVLVENESMLSKQLKIASGFSLSRKKTKFNPEDPTEPIVNKNNGMAFDSLIGQLQMGTHVCIADFEYLISKKGEPYGWGVARYCTPEAMYPELFPIKDQVDGRTPEESRIRIIEHLCGLFPDVEKKKIEKLI
ncbi:MAG: hypothetical protein J6Y11_08505 [Paludibacteraceae bacterium]|nr:hypothetical protein [Paludibacteraceae bacterium]